MKAMVYGLLALAFLWIFPAPSFSSYSYQDLHPAGWLESHGVSVNGSGDVAGYGMTSAGERGFLWSSGSLTVLLPPGATSARASWVNGQGDVAGTAVIGGTIHAFLYRGGAYLDPTPGWRYSDASFVGDDGAVTGTGESGAFISLDGVVEILPGFSAVTGKNSSGQILGSSGGAARLFRPGSGYISLSPPGSSSVVPRGLNESGLIAISSLQANSETGYVYSGGFYVFMTPPGWSSSNAMAVNNLSQVTGYGVSPAGRRSFVRTGANYEDLSFPGWNATEAVSIGDSGQVAGSGEASTGETHAFRASPSSAAAVEAVGPSPGGSGGGGCSVATGTVHGRFTASSAANLIVLLLPLFFLGIRVRFQPTSSWKKRESTCFARSAFFTGGSDMTMRVTARRTA